MSDMRKLIEALDKIDEAGYLLDPIPGQSHGMRDPGYPNEESVTFAAKFAIKTALREVGDAAKVLPWLEANFPVIAPEIKTKIQELLSQPITEGGDTVPRTATQINLGDLGGLEVNRLVRQLERLGLQQAKDFYIKSGSPSWVLNQAYSHEVDGILASYGVGEEISENDGYKVGDPHPSDERPVTVQKVIGELYRLYTGLSKVDLTNAPIEMSNEEASAWSQGVSWANDELKKKIDELHKGVK